MAYQSDNLSVLAYANGFTLWHYTTAETGATVDTAGYFDEAADMLRAGDMMLANVETDGDAPKATIFHVNGVAAGQVELENLTSVGDPQDA